MILYAPLYAECGSKRAHTNTYPGQVVPTPSQVVPTPSQNVPKPKCPKSSCTCAKSKRTHTQVNTYPHPSQHVPTQSQIVPIPKSHRTCALFKTFITLIIIEIPRKWFKRVYTFSCYLISYIIYKQLNIGVIWI